MSKAPIVFLCSRLDTPGGIERAVVNTANLLHSRGHVVAVLVLDEQTNSFYPLHSGIKLLQARLDFGITAEGNWLTKKVRFLHQVRRLRAMLKELSPHCVVGTEYPFVIAAYLAVGRHGTAVYAWEHHHFHWLEKSWFWQTLFRQVYRRVKAVVCLNETEAKLYASAGCRTAVIPNFVERGERADSGSKTILSIGWLIHRKGFDQIPAIAEKLFAAHPGWRWIIIGKGPEEETLRTAISNARLSDKLLIQPPASPDLAEAYRNAALYVMTSRFECLPMVLLEAMAHGVPCISFDCPTGPGYIISDGIDGHLLQSGDTKGMAAAIKDLMENEKKRVGFSDAAYQNILRFSPDEAYRLWQQLLFDTIKQDG